MTATEIGLQITAKINIMEGKGNNGIRIFKKRKIWKGSGGWKEDFEWEKIPTTKFVSKSTGKTVCMPNHKDRYTAKEIRKYIISNYDKTYRKIFHSMSFAEIKADFLD